MPSHVLQKGDAIQFQVNGEAVDFDESQWTLNGRSVLTNFKEHFKLSTATCKEFEKGKFMLAGTTSKSNAALIGGVALASTMAFTFWNRKVLTQFFNNPSQMGEIAPVSSTTVNALLAPLVKRLGSSAEPVTALEVGAGTGGITQKLVELKTKYKNLNVTIVEFNKEFEPVLKQIIGNSGVELKIEDYTKLPKNEYDFIISTVPEQSLDAAVVKTITNKMHDELKNGGSLTRVRYVLKLRWIAPFFKKEKADNIREAFKVSSEFDEKHKAESKLILWNIPPIYVLTIQNPK
jgi:phospholipid N-methyltransferase